MKKFLLGSVAAAGLLGSVIGFGAFAAPGDPPAPPSAAEIQRMQEDHAVMLDSHLAGMKAGLKLTADQEKNWAPFEAAVREASKAHEDAMRQMHAAMGAGERPSPIQHMQMMSEGMAKMSTQLKSVADAAKPLYDSLTDAQKRHFGPLLRGLVEHGPHGGPMMGGFWGHGGMMGGGGPGMGQ